MLSSRGKLVSTAQATLSYSYTIENSVLQTTQPVDRMLLHTALTSCYQHMHAYTARDAPKSVWASLVWALAFLRMMTQYVLGQTHVEVDELHVVVQRQQQTCFATAEESDSLFCCRQSMSA